MRLLTLAFPSASAFLEAYSDAYENGAVFCDTRAELELDDAVLVEIDFPDLPNRALVRGRVVSLVAGAGAWVRFAEEDRATRAYLVRVATGDDSVPERVERTHRRFPAELPVDCQIEELDEPDQDRLVSRTHDVGAGGAFIRSPSPPPIGTRVSLVIGPTLDTGERFHVHGRVAWARRDDDACGFGVCFDPHRNHDTRRLRALLRKASETGRLLFADD